MLRMAGQDHSRGREHEPDATLKLNVNVSASARGSFAVASAPPLDGPKEVDWSPRRQLDQHAEMQRPSAALPAAFYGFDPFREISMLRHKVRALEELVANQGLGSRVQMLSEMEEARALQYRSECLAAACVQQNLDVLEHLRLSVDGAPVGFTSWLQHHADFQSFAQRPFSDRGYGNQSRQYPPLFASHKCHDERCPHYIYGFHNHIDRDNHVLSHSQSPTSQNPPKRESSLSMDTRAVRSPSAHDTPRQLPYTEPASRVMGHPSLPPLSLQTHKPNTRSESSISYTFPGVHPGSRRASIDPEVDPTLPPLKRARVSQPRLESIGELQLFRDDQPCLKCKATGSECDSNQPCRRCLDQQREDRDGFWGTLGCYRGSVPSLVDIFLPEPLSPRQTRTPITSPLAQRRNVNEYIQRAYPSLSNVSYYVKSNLDFHDGFWWSAQFDQRNAALSRVLDHGHDWANQSPPVLCSIASSWNSQNTAYSLMELLKLTGSLAPTREVEEDVFPALYHVKTLLREVLFYSLIQPEPVIRMGSSPSHRLAADEQDFDESTRLLHECTIRFLQSYDAMLSRRSAMHPREWLAMFCSLCIFSAIRTILLDLAETSPNAHFARNPFGSAPHDPRQGMQAAYKALVRLFVTNRPLFLDGDRGDLPQEDIGLYNYASRVFRQDTWAGQQCGSSVDFLMTLGEGSVELLGFNGFVRQFRAAQDSDDVPKLPPILKPGHGHVSRRSVPTLQSPAEAVGPRDRPLEQELLHKIIDSSSVHAQGHGRARRHTVAEGSSYMASPGATFSPPSTAASRFRPSYQRPPLRRVFCNKCNEYPEGFRGEHELRRHTDAKHAALVKRWVCSEPQGMGPPNPQPVVPLSKCKACQTQKHYGAYYNAAAHLRRAHFNPHRGSKASGDWPPMSILKDWMHEVRQPADAPDNDSSSGDDEDLKKDAEYYAAQGSERPTDANTPRVVLPLSANAQFLSSPTDAPSGSLSVSIAPAPLSISAIVPDAAPGSASRAQPWSGRTSPTVRVIENRNRCPHPDCGRNFKDLAAHMLTHQEERPEKCPIESCEYHVKGFARKYDKNRHALTHYKGTMVCPFCPSPGTAYEKAFNRADVFKRHLTSVHGVEQTPPNSRKPTITGFGPGGSSATADGLGARCSICHNRFSAAQEFYEHLDDCVLNVIVPSGSKPSQHPPPALQQQTMNQGPDYYPPPRSHHSPHRRGYNDEQRSRFLDRHPSEQPPRHSLPPMSDAATADISAVSPRSHRKEEIPQLLASAGPLSETDASPDRTMGSFGPDRMALE
jgi:hypothetical protein